MFRVQFVFRKQIELCYIKTRNSKGDFQDRVYKVLMPFTLEMETLKAVQSLIKITVNSSLSKLNIYRALSF